MTNNIRIVWEMLPRDAASSVNNVGSDCEAMQNAVHEDVAEQTLNIKDPTTSSRQDSDFPSTEYMKEHWQSAQDSNPNMLPWDISDLLIRQWRKETAEQRKDSDQSASSSDIPSIIGRSYWVFFKSRLRYDNNGHVIKESALNAVGYVGKTSNWHRPFTAMVQVLDGNESIEKIAAYMKEWSDPKGGLIPFFHPTKSIADAFLDEQAAIDYFPRSQLCNAVSSVASAEIDTLRAEELFEEIWRKYGQYFHLIEPIRKEDIGSHVRWKTTWKARNYLIGREEECELTARIPHLSHEHTLLGRFAEEEKEGNRKDAVRCLWDGCTESFDSENSVYEHIRQSHPRPAPFLCLWNGCEKTTAFLAQRKQLEHVSMHLQLKRFECQVCFALFRSSDQLRKHGRIHEKKSDVSTCARNDQPNPICKWDSCGEIFESKKCLSKHLEEHALPLRRAPFRCLWDGCTRKTAFSQKVHLEAHFLNHTMYKGYVCYMCGHHFSNRNRMDEHKVRIHDDNKSFTSDQSGSMTCEWDGCGMIFESKKHLHNHIMNEHDFPDPFFCLWRGCVKHTGFPATQSLFRHILIHMEFKTNICESCGNAYTSPHLLQLHKNKTHKEMIRMDTTVGDVSADGSSEVLEQSGSMTCEWDGCGIIFESKKDLYIHIEKDHPKLSPFFCRWFGCTKETGTGNLSSLLEHIRSHLDFKTFICSVCGKSLINNHELNVHIQRKHRGMKIRNSTEESSKVKVEIPDRLRCEKNEKNKVAKGMKSEKIEENAPISDEDDDFIIPKGEKKKPSAQVNSQVEKSKMSKRGKDKKTALSSVPMKRIKKDMNKAFFIAAFQNGNLSTIKASYVTRDTSLRVIRPLVLVREKALREFAVSAKLPVVAENCPACFNQATERHRIKQMLAQQELLFPDLFCSLRSALRPLLLVDSASTSEMRKKAIENIVSARKNE